MDRPRTTPPPTTREDDVFEDFAREFIRRHPGPSWPVGCIIAATDFSLSSLGALEHAAALARRLDAELLLLHAQGGPDRMHPAAQPELERTVERLRNDGVRARSLLRPGPAHQEILETAERERASLVVMGTHGRSGLERMLLGSVAERVVRGAPCPVLTVGERAQGPGTKARS